MEPYLNTYCEIDDLNAAFKRWVQARAGLGRHLVGGHGQSHVRPAARQPAKGPLQPPPQA